MGAADADVSAELPAPAKTRRRSHGWDQPSADVDAAAVEMMALCSERIKEAPAQTEAVAKATADAEDFPYKHRRTARELKRCKKGQRSELGADEWGKFGYAAKADAVFSRPLGVDGVSTLPLPRVRRSDITPEEFFEKFALPRRPCIIEGAIDDWPAMSRWGVEHLSKAHRNTPFKVGEDDKGRKLRMKLKYFLDYMTHQRDDSPLYLFETRVDGDAQGRKLLEDFLVPDLFPHDFFDLVPPHAKPPFRWWSIGPKRSGTTVHQDPLGTAAWNAVTHGRKRWVLFEPTVKGKIAKGKDFIDKANGEDDEAMMYFDFILPRIRDHYPDVTVYLADQGPGEVIFVPGDWWHGVVNLEDTIAVTQNYVGLDNFDTVWMRTRRERVKLAYQWLRNMRKFAPHLHSRALELNTRDRFRMRQDQAPRAASEKSGSGSSSSSSDSSSAEEEDLLLERVRPPHAAHYIAPWLRTLSEGEAEKATSEAGTTVLASCGDGGAAPVTTAAAAATPSRKRPREGESEAESKSLQPCESRGAEE
eukprot:TRINITY_DN5075_c2_g5_i2.p1 TRINITY_DN5075_c2_g5~~TRINITY_DN5075_c2_g5_i2.p1  ORF type:complete len:531 (+),score=97.52 TRINITY_DN5075_c2_g5_i2:68-1660(+)